MPILPDQDPDLLARYAASRDHAAFAQLVRRHLDLVHSAAARRLRDPHLAEDVTQAVFMILARKPPTLRPGLPLSAWLLTTVRLAAANATKLRRRRTRHEQNAAARNTFRLEESASPNPADVLIWQDVAAQLDDAVLRLPAPDRRAVLLRYFEQRPIRDVAQSLGVSEAAAKQRLSRSLDKLRHRLNRRGASLAPGGAAGLATLLTAHAVRAAPATLPIPTVTGAATGGATALSIAKGTITMMTWTKIKTAAAALALASILGAGVVVTLDHARAQAPARNAAPAQSNPAADLRDKAAARVRAAQRLVDARDAEFQAGNVPLSPALIDLRAAAYRRLADARIDAAETTADRLAAAQAYVRQCTDLLELLKARAAADATPAALRQGEYHLADADYLLAKLRASAAAPN